jgi:hypothetical protein
MIYSTIVNQFGCNANSKHTVQLPSSSNGMEENGIKLFDVYPNPFKDKISVNIFESGELSLIDELGKIVITKNVIKGDLSEILTDQLVQGFYVMQIKNDQGVYQSKLLKSN